MLSKFCLLTNFIVLYSERTLRADDIWTLWQTKENLTLATLTLIFLWTTPTVLTMKIRIGMSLYSILQLQHNRPITIPVMFIFIVFIILLKGPCIVLLPVLYDSNQYISVTLINGKADDIHTASFARSRVYSHSR